MSFSLKTHFKGPFVSEKPPKQSLEWEIKKKLNCYVPKNHKHHILWKNFTPEPHPKKLPKILGRVLDFTVITCNVMGTEVILTI